VSKASELAKRLVKMEPSAETVREIAQMRLEDGRPNAALQAYGRAVEQGAELKAEDHFNRGTAFQKMGQLAKARSEYRKAIDRREDFGQAYIAIGDLYAKAVNQCSGGEMARNDKAVYWAAVDKYQQAKRVNSTVASVADSKAKTYRKVFPTKEDIFYREDWERGQSATIDYGCYSWIGETTTVRSAPSSN
jgi:tetratricopeptide (TPR) repeat protein